MDWITRLCTGAALGSGYGNTPTKTRAMIRDAFAKCNEGWQIMLNFDIAGIADFKPSEIFICLGKPGEQVAEAARKLAARQTAPEQIFQYFNSFMKCRSYPVPAPITNEDWRSLGESCFWLGHLNTESPAREWVTEELLTRVLEAENIEAMGDACIGVYILWGERYRESYEKHIEEIHAKLRSAVRAVSFIEKGDTLYATFIMSRQETILFSKDHTPSTATKQSAQVETGSQEADCPRLINTRKAIAERSRSIKTQNSTQRNSF